MKKVILFTISFLFVFSLTKAQSVNNRKNMPLYTETGTIRVKTKSAETSNYFGYDNKIKEIFIENNIPEKFPTKDGFTDKTNYLAVANEWIKAHQALIKSEFKNTLIKD